MAIDYDFVRIRTASGTGDTAIPAGYLKMKRLGFAVEALKLATTGADNIVATLPAGGVALSQGEAADIGLIAFAMVKSKKGVSPSSTSKIPVPLASFASAVGRSSPMVGKTVVGKLIQSTKPAGAPRFRG